MSSRHAGPGQSAGTATDSASPAHEDTQPSWRPLVLLEMAAPVAARAVEAILKGDYYDVV